MTGMVFGFAFETAEGWCWLSKRERKKPEERRAGLSLRNCAAIEFDVSLDLAICL